MLKRIVFCALAAVALPLLVPATSAGAVTAPLDVYAVDHAIPTGVDVFGPGGVSISMSMVNTPWGRVTVLKSDHRFRYFPTICAPPSGPDASGWYQLACFTTSASIDLGNGGGSTIWIDQTVTLPLNLTTGNGSDWILDDGTGGAHIDAGPGADFVDAWNGVKDTVNCGYTFSANNVKVHDGAHDTTWVDSGLDTRPYCVKGEDSTY